MFRWCVWCRAYDTARRARPGRASAGDGAPAQGVTAVVAVVGPPHRLGAAAARVGAGDGEALVVVVVHAGRAVVDGGGGEDTGGVDLHGAVPAGAGVVADHPETGRPRLPLELHDTGHAAAEGRHAGEGAAVLEDVAVDHAGAL